MSKSWRSLRVTDAFRAFVLDQLAELGDVTPRSMFGGVGLYCRGVFFAILAHDRLYFKTDDRSRRDYTRARMPAFRPYRGRSARNSSTSKSSASKSPASKSYFAVPLSVLEDPNELTVWARKAVAAGSRARRA